MPMIRVLTDQDPETVFDGVALDDVTVGRLMALCEHAKVPPKIIIAAIVRDVLEDDANEHDEPTDVARPDANHDLH